MHSGTTVRTAHPSTRSPQWYLQEWDNGSYYSYTIKNNAYNSYFSTTTPNPLLEQQQYVPVQQSQTPYFWLALKMSTTNPPIFELVTHLFLSQKGVDDTTRMFSWDNDSMWYIPNTTVGTQVSSIVYIEPLCQCLLNIYYPVIRIQQQ